jgi:hypothetical protein
VTLGFRLQISMTCDVCKQTLNEEGAEATRVEAALFGSMAYAVCPSCGQEMAAPHSKAYKRRCDKFIKARNTP